MLISIAFMMLIANLLFAYFFRNDKFWYSMFIFYSGIVFSDILDYFFTVSGALS